MGVHRMFLSEGHRGSHETVQEHETLMSGSAAIDFHFVRRHTTHETLRCERYVVNTPVLGTMFQFVRRTPM